MHTIQFEITLPTDESAFEDMCACIYGEVFNDPTPILNGRRGQAQAGIDVFVESNGGRIGIQCKRYADGTLKFTHIQKEIGRADKAQAPITKLIIATTAASDAKLIRQVQDLSDQREVTGLFPVQVQFWNDICGHIRRSAKLQRDYAPNAPGAMFSRQEESNLALMAQMQSITSSLDVVAGLPGSRPGAVGTHVSIQLDAVNELLQACRFSDALEYLQRQGKSLELFDNHQKARWYMQRGVCIWLLENGEAASTDFLKAAELYPADEKMAAAGIRGLLLRRDVPAAMEAGIQALETFPASLHVWLAFANARMLNGDNLSLTDAPLAIREEFDVLHMVAMAREHVGDLEGAIELICRALDQPGAGFFVRSTALGLALKAATADPIRCHFGVLSEEKIKTLEHAVAPLSPRQERLWSVQSPGTLEDTAAHLGYAYIVLNRPSEALELIDEARRADKVCPRLMQVALEAYRRLDRINDILSYGRSWLNNLEEDGLILVAEAAASLGDVVLVEEVTDSLMGLPFHKQETENLLTALRWDALWQSRDGQARAIDEVKAANLTASDNLVLVCGGTQILHRAGEEAERDEAVSRAIELLDDTSPDPSVMHVAELLYMVGRYREAAKYYQRFAVRGKISDLHCRLLACYVKGGERRKARELIQSLPSGWAADDQLRSLALELGQLAADLELLEPLAEIQCEHSPNHAGGWLLRLSLDLKMKKMLRFHQTLATLPDELSGTPEQIAQLASFEIKYDQQRSGMKRLYRLYRRDMDSLEAATGFFVGIVMPCIDLPNMEEVLPVVIEGTAVRMKDGFGSDFVVCIDPQEAAPLPFRDGFYSVESPEIEWLLGAQVGECIERKGPLGTTQTFEILSITSVHRHLLQLAESKFRNSMTGNGAIASLPIVQTEQGADFSYMHAMLKQQAERTKTVFNGYTQQPLTLGMLSRLLGTSVVDIVCGWTLDNPPLFVCIGTEEERTAADTLLARDEASYVVDAATMAELVWLECQPALAALSSVFCSTKTLELLEAKLHEAQENQSVGHVFDAGEGVQFIEHTIDHRERQIAFLSAIVEAVHDYCTVVPAYGPEAIPASFQNAGRLMADEEYSALLLTVERNATLLTVDGRLAQLAKVILEVPSVWPQMLLHHASRMQLISSRAYLMAIVREFIGNRTFVSLAASDLVLMCLQGGSILRYGLQHYKNYLSNQSVELASSVDVLFEFLTLQSQQRTQLGAFLELLTHVVEAVLRHPNCDIDAFMMKVECFADRVAAIEAGPSLLFPSSVRVNKARYQTIRNTFQDALNAAHEFAMQPVRCRAIRLKVLMGTWPPSLQFDGDVPEPEDISMEAGSAPLEIGAEVNSDEASAP